MIKVSNLNKMNGYIEKYNIDNMFSMDMKPFMELVLFKKNEYICRENEYIKYFFLFVEGKAKVYITLSNGKSLLICFDKEFQTVGEMEVINSEAAATNIQVLQDTYCIAIPMEQARAHLLEDTKFLRFIGDSLGKKLDRNLKNSSINLLYPLEKRLASYILATGEEIYDVGESLGESGKRTIRFRENLTEISEMLGTSYRHLLRTLNNLCSKGILMKKDNYFEVINQEFLRKLAADLYK